MEVIFMTEKEMRILGLLKVIEYHSEKIESLREELEILKKELDVHERKIEEARKAFNEEFEV